MTGFASADFLKSTSSEEVSMRCFSAFFIPNGLPRLVIIDAGSEFKGVLVAMCDSLGIAYHVLAAEDHNGILCERFHRYLNKVEKIQIADTQSYTQWAQGVLFGLYAWNASPSDGTNIIRSFVAKGRVFPFPIQLKEESNPPRIPTGQGEAAIQHLETYFPLWAKQQTLLQILVEERRERHRELKNLGKKQRTFSVGDLVVAKRQLKSDASRGISAKLSIDKVKGPYRVLEPIGDRSYMIQKMPIFQGQGKPGKPRKASGAALERIPSTLVVNKRVDSTDTRLAALEKPLVHNPLEKALGFYQFGRYVQAPKTADFAFDRVEDLWQIEVEDSDSESEEESEGNEARAARATAASDNPRDSPDTRVEAAVPAANNIEAGKETSEPSADNTDAGQVDEEGTAFVGPTLADRIKAASRTASRKRSLASVDSQEEPQPKRRLTGLESFYDKVRASRDKLFIIAKYVGNRPKKTWFVVQVDWDETSKRDAKSEGRYHVRWYVRHFRDSTKRSAAECRYWPEIHELLKDESLGCLRVVAPGKVETTLKKKRDWAWYQQEIDLFTEHVVGPFDFTIINRENYRIDEEVWSKLREVAAGAEIDASSIDRCEPLESYY